jgi:hypothetical protein
VRRAHGASGGSRAATAVFCWHCPSRHLATPGRAAAGFAAQAAAQGACQLGFAGATLESGSFSLQGVCMRTR